MRTSMMTCALLAVLLAAVSPAGADPVAAKDVGIGVGVGLTTGINAQLRTTPLTHVGIGFGLSLDDHMRLHTDYDWRVVDLARSLSVSVPLYIGFGGFVTDRSASTSTDVGVRMPVGIQADFRRAPVQIFAEVAPELVVVQMVPAAMEPHADVLVVGGIAGVRAAF